MTTSDPTDYWPVVGTIVSDNIEKAYPIVVKVPHVNKWLQSGETVLWIDVQDGVPDNIKEEVRVEWVTEETLRVTFFNPLNLAANLDYVYDHSEIVFYGDRFTGDISDATPSMLFTLLGIYEAGSREIQTIDDIFTMLSGENDESLVLSPDTSSVMDVIRHMECSRDFMGQMAARGRQHLLFGKETLERQNRSLIFDKIVVRMLNIYRLAQITCELRRSQKDEYKPSEANCFGFQSVLADPKSKEGTPELLEELLAHTYKTNLKRQGRTVFQQQDTSYSVWKSADDCCTAKRKPDAVDHEFDCQGQHVYGIRHSEDMGWCLSYAQYYANAHPLQKVENLVFNTLKSCVNPKPIHSGIYEALGANEDGTPNLCRIKGVGCRTWIARMKDGMPMNTEQLVMEVLDRRVFNNTARWRMFVENFSRNKKCAAEYMECCNDPAFASYMPDHKLFSFQNGMYHIDKNEFYEYGSIPSNWSVGINYIPQYFDPLLTTMPLESIEVPGYDEILQSQDYHLTTGTKVPQETLKFWMDVFVGRMFFRLGELDGWQRILIITGQGATGKSTIAKALQKLVGERNVGIIPSNCEAQWALANIQNKTMWMCTEMKANFRLDMSVMQNMVSGDPVTIHAKFKDAVDVPAWATHGFLVGNEFPTSWLTDAGGALTRRAVPFRFNNAGDGQKPSIQTDFYNNLAPFLVRTTRRYRYAAGKYKASLPFPEQLERYQKEFQVITTPFFQFLKDTTTHGGFALADKVLDDLRWMIICQEYLHVKEVSEAEFDPERDIKGKCRTSVDNSVPAEDIVCRFNVLLAQIPLNKSYLKEMLENCDYNIRQAQKPPLAPKLVFGQKRLQNDTFQREAFKAALTVDVATLTSQYDVWRKTQKNVPALDLPTLETTCKQNNWLYNKMNTGGGDKIIGLITTADWLIYKGEDNSPPAVSAGAAAGGS